jgi:hypothetical protein
MEREKAKKLHIRLTALIAAVMIVCSFPSVSFAKEGNGAETPIQQTSPDPGLSQASAVLETPQTDVPVTPVPTPSAVASVPFTSFAPMAEQTAVPEPVSNLKLIKVNTSNRWVLPDQNNNKNFIIEVYNINGTLLESETRLYEQGSTGFVDVALSGLTVPFYQSMSMTVVLWNEKSGKIEEYPFTNGQDIKSINAGHITFLRIKLAQALSVSDTCTFKGQAVDLTKLVPVPSGYTGTVEFYGTNNSLITAPAVYAPDVTGAVTARAKNGNVTFYEDILTVYVIDPVISPSVQTVMLGQSASISVMPVPLSCGLHTGSSFAFEWTASSPDAGLPQANGQGVTVTPLKTGTYTYSVRITHSRGTDTIEKTLTATVTVLTGTLTITHSGSSAADAGQSFVFQIVYHGTDGSSRTFYEIIRGNGTAVTNGLGAGTYTVTPVSGWSWRYSTGPSGRSVTLDAGNPSGSADFTSSRTILAWLSGEAFAVNRNPAGAP